ncbi:class I SAM-dependent methyltransferase [Cellvibrio sp.]|uniref:class I SAM-dependent methyltransferase n=1 Tax=Cellvibrio sp. TaxID=1965322 RepID=UPI003964844B
MKYIKKITNILKLYKTKFKNKSHWEKFEKLEIGSGPKKRDGWLTLDYCEGADVFWDLNKKLPFPDNCFNEIYSSHVLEHFKYPQLIALLCELHRVLKPGGKMLISVPDINLYISSYLNNSNINLLRYKPAIISECRIDILNYIFYMDGHHHIMLDAENLSLFTKMAGFNNFEKRPFNHELDPPERDYESFYAVCYKN